MMELFVAADGQIQVLYGEEIPLAEFGGLSICRASHVEPDHSGAWLANMAPVGGPALGPFPRRSQALDAERQWLLNHFLYPKGS
jgi:hypothetical protein